MASLREQWSQRTGRPKEEFSKLTKGMSAREEWAFATGKPVSQYPGGSSKSKKEEESSIEKMLKKVQESILDTTPAFQEVLPDFETTVYNEDLQAEDRAQSEALFNDYFDNQINTYLEDLTNTEQQEGVNYQRSLRRARLSMARSGGAIGTERENADQEITSDYQYGRGNRLRQAERTIGTDKLNAAGFESATQTPQEGSINQERTKSIEEQVLWYKNQRAQRYYGDAQNYYQTSPGVSLTGKKL